MVILNVAGRHGLNITYGWKVEMVGMDILVETTHTHAPRFLCAALSGGTLNNYGELNMTLIDSETGLMKIPLMCDRCKKSEEVLYRVRRWSICKNCADEYREMKEEHNRNMSENIEILRELKNAEFPWFRSLFSFIWR